MNHNFIIIKKALKSYNRFFLILCFIFAGFSVNAQKKWTSPDHGYVIEVPQGFENTYAVGKNVDFKATDGSSSIVVVVSSLPKEYLHYNIWEIMGDLTTYEAEWEKGAREYFDTPDFLKYGKSEIGGQDTFWYDYTTANPKSYSKVYQFQKKAKIYTITLTCPYGSRNYYAPVWYRFKSEVKLK